MTFCNWRLNCFVKIFSTDCDIFVVTVCERIICIYFLTTFWTLATTADSCLLNWSDVLFWIIIRVWCVSPIVRFGVFLLSFLWHIFLLLLTNWNFTTGPGNMKDSCYLIRLMVSYLTSIFCFWWDFPFLFHRNFTLIQTWPILRGIFLIIKLLFSKIWPDIDLIDPVWLLLFVSASYVLTVDEDSNLYGDKNIFDWTTRPTIRAVFIWIIGER